jgi:hypothetical protein
VALNTITHSLVLSENNNITKNTQMSMNHIGGVMVSMFTSSVVDRGFEPRLGQTNSVISQLYHGENKLIFNEMMMRSALF